MDSSTIIEILTISGAIAGGGGLIALLQWWSDRRPTKVSADSTVVDSANRFVEMTTGRLEKQEELIDDLNQRVRELEEHSRNLESRNREWMNGCLKLMAQLVDADLVPSWMPDSHT